ncbi:histidine kinase [Actinoplanes sp. SE50]|uniref:HAMP domain-containing sensor histidine kinase n=1 Tax=unclassified Actinoplanes TaxID=2626549 RepID=UPI00023ED0C9|nr:MULTISPECIES: HAMP domain-containing sensor histidine kinase [unclassified Actinoplanes]AEV86079.1 two-component system, OmpR family, sensor histidine kinase MprB [Actinoplanes sp. SE50/110]ATO84477.1 histidine kinase [Actinoplanes sp. SE50]SLM01887.1 two-component sensor histidine kinase [Actinoplanes sp. SE50/110]
MRRSGRWWRARTLHTRLALLVAAAVGAAVLFVAAGAWVAVREIQRHQADGQLADAAQQIAANPGQWLATESSRTRDLPTLPPPHGPGRGGHHGREIGTCWQILTAAGTASGGSRTTLPVTAAARQVAGGARTRPAKEQITLGPDSYVMLTVPLAGGGAVQVGMDQDPGENVLTAFAALLALGCLAGVGGAALLGRTVARAGLAPVDRLTEAVEHVAATQDLSRSIEVDGTDEIARLGRSVNAMLAAIDASRGAQRALVEDAGHELRTPLTSIRTNVELLLELERRPELAHRLPPEERAKLLADLDAQVQELATLTTELVELAREEATRETVEPVDLSEVVAAAVARVRIRAPGLTYDTDLAPSTVDGRPGELERMVVNVLDNAAKWSPAGAVVRVRLAGAEPGWTELTVTDSGPGIAEEDLPHVFDRFYRATAARSMPGSGLGLAIVAQTASQHGGTVIAAPADGGGTVVTIRLPAAA